MKSPYIYIFVAVWFLHLAVCAGGGYAILRLWSGRGGVFVQRLLFFLSGLLIEGLEALILVILAKGMRWVWPFAIAFFVFVVLKDIVRVPFILLVIKGLKNAEQKKREEISGELPPDFWRNEFRQAIRDEIKHEYRNPPETPEK